MTIEVIADPEDKVTVEGVEYTTFYIACGKAEPVALALCLEMSTCQHCEWGKSICAYHLGQAMRYGS